MSAPPRTQSRIVVQAAAAFGHPGKMRELIGRERTEQILAEQRKISACRRRAGAKAELLDMRLR